MEHERRSPSTEKGDAHITPKQAACLSCRKSKTRCLRDGKGKCRKCDQTGAECLVPEYRVGRLKGVKNKRDGLEKAVYQIEQALKKSKNRASPSEEGRRSLHLHNLLSEAQGILPKPAFPETTFQTNAFSPGQHSGSPRGALRQSAVPERECRDEQFSVDDAENPLQLLARASDLSALSKQPSFTVNVPSSVPRSPDLGDEKLRDFFGPFRPSLDVGPDVDPIDLGLVTDEEAALLFSFFYDNLSHTRWGLDPILHTPQFVRKQSSFLFTSIMAGSALFMPTAAAVSKRLSLHCRFLARNLLINRSRSPEVVLGFMVNIPWMAPGQHWSDDDTCSYMAAALTIAIDISLNKLIVPSPSDSLAGIHEGEAPSDCITARKALELDGFSDVNPNSDLGRRLLRRRERIWLALFVLDRGVCLARGRSFTVPVTTLIENCETWHRSSVADRWDGSVVSSAVFRRDLATLISEAKGICESSHHRAERGIDIAQSLQHTIEGFFNGWYSTWAHAIGGMKDNSIPPYVEILVTHGRLSIYSSLVNHPTAPVEAKRFFRAAGLSSALKVLRAAVQGENRLKSMPNNTSIMICFAACFAFYLSTTGSTGNMSLAPSIRRLIEESAGVLERLGSIPPHRNGTSALHGRHLRRVIGAAPPASDFVSPRQVQTFYAPTTIPQSIKEYPTPPLRMDMAELPHFSSMSDDQINQAISNAGNELDTYIPSLQMEDQSALDWLDWFNMDVNTNG